MSQSSALDKHYLQMLLDSFRGELWAYNGDLPSKPYQAMNWNYLLNAATVMPHLAIDCQHLIEHRLGYLPLEGMLQPQESFLRSLMQQHRSGQLPDEEYKRQADHYIKAMRDRDMQIEAEPVELSVASARYATYLPAYAEQARRRLTIQLGYAPDLAHSLVVELWLRQILARERYALPEEQTPIDRKAVMLVQSREAYAQGGWDAVHELPLPHHTCVLKLKNNEVRTLH